MFIGAPFVALSVSSRFSHLTVHHIICYSAPRGVSASLPQNRPRARGGRGRRGGGGGSGSGGRRGKERSQPRSAEELDAELEKYHAQGTTPMQTTE